VLQPIVEAQRAARLRLGIADQFDGRRLVGNGAELPGEPVAGAVHDGGAVALGSGGANSTPPARAISMRTPPVARTTSWLPAGTDTISLVWSLACACALSPGR